MGSSTKLHKILRLSTNSKQKLILGQLTIFLAEYVRNMLREMDLLTSFHSFYTFAFAILFQNHLYITSLSCTSFSGGFLRGKTTYKWHTNNIRVHTNDKWMTSECIRVIYRWHVSKHEWHTDGIQVHTSDIRMIYGWHRIEKSKPLIEFGIKVLYTCWKILE